MTASPRGGPVPGNGAPVVEPAPPDVLVQFGRSAPPRALRLPSISAVSARVSAAGHVSTKIRVASSPRRVDARRRAARRGGERPANRKTSGGSPDRINAVSAATDRGRGHRHFGDHGPHSLFGVGSAACRHRDSASRSPRRSTARIAAASPARCDRRSEPAAFRCRSGRGPRHHYPGFLAVDPIDATEYRGRAQADIAEIADQRRDQIETRLAGSATTAAAAGETGGATGGDRCASSVSSDPAAEAPHRSPLFRRRGRRCRACCSRPVRAPFVLAATHSMRARAADHRHRSQHRKRPVTGSITPSPSRRRGQHTGPVKVDYSCHYRGRWGARQGHPRRGQLALFENGSDRLTLVRATPKDRRGRRRRGARRHRRWSRHHPWTVACGRSRGGQADCRRRPYQRGRVLDGDPACRRQYLSDGLSAQGKDGPRGRLRARPRPRPICGIGAELGLRASGGRCAARCRRRDRCVVDRCRVL